MLRKQFNLFDKINSVGIENCFISEITIAELYYGCENSNNPKKNIKATDELISCFKVLPISDVVHTFGKCKAQLSAKGCRIENFDMLIGATALKYGLIMVTDNVSHLGRLPGLTIENWIKR